MNGSCLSHKLEIRVRPGDTDYTGNVFNPRYLEWFVKGRHEALRAWDFDFSKDNGVMSDKETGSPIKFVTGEVWCRIYTPSRFNDLLLLHTFIGEIKSKTFKMEHRLYKKEDNKLAAEGYAIYVFLDFEGRNRFKEVIHMDSS